MQTPILYAVSQVSNNPEIINGKTVSGEIIDLHIKNTILRRTDFKKASLYRPHFENVIFEDCNFIDTYIDDGTFENVKFIRGKFAREAADDNYEIQAKMDGSYFTNVEFDDVELVKFDMYFWMKGGVVSLKNISKITESQTRGAGFSTGGGNSPGLISIENCSLKGVPLLITHNKQSRIYVTNSRFVDSGISGEALAFYAENSSFLDRSKTPDSETMVITNCVLSGGMNATKNGYAINNTYPDRSGCNGPPEANYYFVNKERQKVKLHMNGGNFYVYNMELVDSYSRQLNDSRPPVTSMNLKDVTIRGGDWKKARVLNSQWENVQLYPPVDVTNANVGTIRVHNVIYPEGNPWVGSGSYAKIVPSDTPFTWPEIHVPTKEELGMTEKMPEVTGKPSGK